MISIAILGIVAFAVATLLVAVFVAMRIYRTLDFEFSILWIKFRLSGRK